MKAGAWIGFLALLAHAQEVNPVRPAAAKLLADRAHCIAFAEQVGDALRPTGKADVYTGDAGVALLYAGLFRATKKPKWRDSMEAALERALATDVKSAGLYTGLAGIGQACLEAHAATGDARWLARAADCAKRLDDVPRMRVADVISGEAGVGIFLLNLHQATGGHLAAASAAGDWLAKQAVRVRGAAHWRVGPRIYVGFSHGAAGIGYFLLHLHKATGDARYRTLALEAARFVSLHAQPEGEDGVHWWRTVPPDTTEMRRIQWCHGAPGTGLFYSDLARYVGGKKHRAMLDRCLATTRRHGRTARRSGCQCHGVAGNAELFLEVYAARKDEALLKEARAFGSVLLTPDGDGFRVKTSGEPSFMVGDAGIGHYFLRLADPGHTRMPLMVREAE